MPERTVFKGRDGSWYAVEETESGSGVRIEMACLGSTEQVAEIEQGAREARATRREAQNVAQREAQREAQGEAQGEAQREEKGTEALEGVD